MLELNKPFVTGLDGILKFVEMFLGILSISLCSQITYFSNSSLFTYLMSMSFFVTTSLIVLSSSFSEKTSSLLGQTIFEIAYHGCGFLLLFIGSITALSEGSPPNGLRQNDYLIAAGSFALMNSFAYAGSTVNQYMKYVNS